jgi:hypothetical protein
VCWQVCFGEFGVLVAIWAAFGGNFGALWSSFAKCLGRMTAAGLIHRTIERTQGLQDDSDVRRHETRFITNYGSSLRTTLLIIDINSFFNSFFYRVTSHNESH